MCIYIYIYINKYIYIYVYIYTFIYIYIHMYVCVYAYVYMAGIVFLAAVSVSGFSHGFSVVSDFRCKSGFKAVSDFRFQGGFQLSGFRPVSDPHHVRFRCVLTPKCQQSPRLTTYVSAVFIGSLLGTCCVVPCFSCVHQL